MTHTGVKLKHRFKALIRLSPFDSPRNLIKKNSSLTFLLAQILKFRFFDDPLLIILTSYLKGQNRIMPIFKWSMPYWVWSSFFLIPHRHIFIANDVWLVLMSCLPSPTRGRYFYHVPSRHLCKRKMPFKASGRRHCRCHCRGWRRCGHGIALVLCK